MAAELNLLGKFSMSVDGQDKTAAISGSKKKVDLIYYLILNRQKNVLPFDMFDALWPGNDNGNPESSLKTLVSRTRTVFEEMGLYDVIVTRSGFYMWNSDCGITVDVFELERLHAKLMPVQYLTPEIDADFMRVIALYNGDLVSTASSSDSWIVPKSMYYHNLYVEAVSHYIKLLGDEKRNNDIIYVARKALDIDPFDSELNLRLLEALTALGRHQEALAQYNCTNNIHYTYLGIRPSEEILTFYKNLICIENDSSDDIEAIRRELESGDNERGGAFMCEYAIFKDIYQLNMRNLKRLGASMFLALVCLSAIDRDDTDYMLLDKMVTELGETIRDNLRKGDTVSRYSANKFTLLLPMVDYNTGNMVMERIKAAFYKKRPGTRYILNCFLRPLSSPSSEGAPHSEHKKI